MVNLDFDKNQTLNFTSKLSHFEIVNQEFIRCKCYMLATGDNVNGSDITLESVKKALARNEFDNKPVIAHLYQDIEDNGKWRVGGHDSKWIITNTSIDMINECIPFGVIPESANLQLEEVLEADGVTTNTYLTCQILLWTGRFNIMDAAYSDDIYFNQSCEISVNEYHYKDNGVCAIDDFTFSALCLLNKSSDLEKNVRPCFPSCRVEKIKSFSINEDSFKQNFNLMLKKLKQYEADGITTVQNKVTKNQKGERTMDLKKFMQTLSTEKSGNYRLLSVNDTQIFALDMEDYKPYGFNYGISKENDEEFLTIDFESKVELSLSATEKITEEDFEEFDIKNEIDTIKEAYSKKNVEEKVAEATAAVSAEFQKDYDSLKEAYDTLLEAHKLATTKVDEYERQEKEFELQQHKNKIDELVNKYAEKLGKYSSFLVYKANIETHYSKTCEQVEQDLILMAGKYLTSKENLKNKAFSYAPTETKACRITAAESKYGHLLDKYIQ